jgi:hypothetical protein
MSQSVCYTCDVLTEPLPMFGVATCRIRYLVGRSGFSELLSY